MIMGAGCRARTSTLHHWHTPCLLHTDAIIAITCIILFLLFLVQMFGTAKISHAFSPIVFVWLIFNMVCGFINIFNYDSAIFEALSPYWAIKYFADDFGQAWRSLSAILLSFTGVEALFADLGHFDRPSIQISSMCLVFPCITFTYLGQAAYLMVCRLCGMLLKCSSHCTCHCALYKTRHCYLKTSEIPGERGQHLLLEPAQRHVLADVYLGHTGHRGCIPSPHFSRV